MYECQTNNLTKTTKVKTVKKEIKKWLNKYINMT